MLVNLTPHAVVVLAEDGTVIADIPPSGTVARLAEGVAEAESIGGIPHATVTLGRGVGLPDAWLYGASTDTNTYIVSMPFLMGMRATGRDSAGLVYPFGQVRDDAGRIIGCRSLATLA